MKFKDIVFIVLLVAACGFFYMLSKKENNNSTDHKIDSLYRANRVLIHFDSVQTAMINKIIDSVMKINAPLIKQLNTLHNETINLRKQNAELEKNYRSIVVDRPDF